MFESLDTASQLLNSGWIHHPFLNMGCDNEYTISKVTVLSTTLPTGTPVGLNSDENREGGGR